MNLFERATSLNLFERMTSRRQFAEDETKVIDQVQTICRLRIAPRAAQVDRTAEFPWDNVKDLNELGLNSMFIPEAYGGSPLS